MFQPNFKSGSRADIQGGAESAPPRIWQEKNSPDLIGLRKSFVEFASECCSVETALNVLSEEIQRMQWKLFKCHHKMEQNSFN